MGQKRIPPGLSAWQQNHLFHYIRSQDDWLKFLPVWKFRPYGVCTVHRSQNTQSMAWCRKHCYLLVLPIINKYCKINCLYKHNMSLVPFNSRSLSTSFIVAGETHIFHLSLIHIKFKLSGKLWEKMYYLYITTHMHKHTHKNVFLWERKLHDSIFYQHIDYMIIVNVNDKSHIYWYLTYQSKGTKPVAKYYRPPHIILDLALQCPDVWHQFY